MMSGQQLEGLYTDSDIHTYSRSLAGQVIQTKSIMSPSTNNARSSWHGGMSMTHRVSQDQNNKI